MQFSQRVNQSMRPNTSSGSLFFTSTPALQELCSVYITVSSQQMKNGSVNSFQPQVIKCRELIFTEPEIIASPVIGSGGKVQIIAQINVFKSGKLQARFQRMNVEVSKPKRVAPCDYQTCLKYTLHARMAPLWNKVGDYLVQGREFVTSTQKMNALMLSLNVNETDLYLTVKAFQVRIPPIKLDDLNISGRIQERFLQKEQEDLKIDEYAIENKWCHILPSMKKGMVVNILQNFPSDSPFKSYKDVKKYWKNMYGYRLPETSDGMLYYQVYFKPIGHTLFTYPECCIRLRDIATFDCPQSEQIVQQFLEDLQSKMPLLCGQKMHFKNQALYTVPMLKQIEREDEKNELPSNLSKVPVYNQSTQFRINKPVPLQENRIEPYTAWTPSAMQSQSSDKLPRCRSDSSSHINSFLNPGNNSINGYSEHTVEGNNESTSKLRINDKLGKNTSASLLKPLESVTKVGSDVRSASEQHQLSVDKEVASTESSVDIHKRIVPSFKPKIKRIDVLNRSLANENIDVSKPKFVPVFKGRKTPSSTVSTSGNSIKEPVNKFTCSSSDMFSDLNKLKAKLGSLVTTDLLDNEIKSVTNGNRQGHIGRNNVQMPNVTTADNINQGRSFSDVRSINNNVLTGMQKPNFNTTKQLPSYKMKNNERKHSDNVPHCDNLAIKKKSNCKKNFTSDSKKVIGTDHTVPNTPDHFTVPNDSTEFYDSPVLSSGTHSRAFLSQEESNCLGLKRKLNEPLNDDIKVKKQRAKPKVQEGIDVEECAMSNQLGKVNTLTLVTWLKTKGIPCRSRDKKTDLVNKVLETLHLNVVVEP